MDVPAPEYLRVSENSALAQMEDHAGQHGWVDLAQQYLLGKKADRLLRITQADAKHAVERGIKANAKLRNVFEGYVTALERDGSVAACGGEITGIDGLERLASLNSLLLKNETTLYNAVERMTLGKLKSLSAGALNVAQAGLSNAQRELTRKKRITGMDKLPVIEIPAEAEETENEKAR